MDDSTVREAVEDAWSDAVEEWESESDLDEADMELVRELGLLGEFEYFWDEEFQRVGYESPAIPKDWKTKPYSSDVRSWAQVSKINMALNDLGMKVRVEVEEGLGVE